jgi:hypothetical protein
MKKARRNFDDHYSTELTGQSEFRQQKQLALGKEGTVGRTEKDARTGSGKFRPPKLSNIVITTPHHGQ